MRKIVFLLFIFIASLARGQYVPADRVAGIIRGVVTNFGHLPLYNGTNRFYNRDLYWCKYATNHNGTNRLAGMYKYTRNLTSTNWDIFGEGNPIVDKNWASNLILANYIWRSNSTQIYPVPFNKAVNVWKITIGTNSLQPGKFFIRTNDNHIVLWNYDGGADTKATIIKNVDGNVFAITYVNDNFASGSSLMVGQRSGSTPTLTYFPYGTFGFGTNASAARMTINGKLVVISNIDMAGVGVANTNFVNTKISRTNFGKVNISNYLSLRDNYLYLDSSNKALLYSSGALVYLGSYGKELFFAGEGGAIVLDPSTWGAQRATVIVTNALNFGITEDVGGLHLREVDGGGSATIISSNYSGSATPYYPLYIKASHLYVNTNITLTDVRPLIVMTNGTIQLGGDVDDRIFYDADLYGCLRIQVERDKYFYINDDANSRGFFIDHESMKGSGIMDWDSVTLLKGSMVLCSSNGKLYFSDKYISTNTLYDYIYGWRAISLTSNENDGTLMTDNKSILGSLREMYDYMQTYYTNDPTVFTNNSAILKTNMEWTFTPDRAGTYDIEWSVEGFSTVTAASGNVYLNGTNINSYCIANSVYCPRSSFIRKELSAVANTITVDFADQGGAPTAYLRRTRLRVRRVRP